jgi:hypothetical protein
MDTKVELHWYRGRQRQSRVDFKSWQIPESQTEVEILDLLLYLLLIDDKSKTFSFQHKV